MRYLILYLEAFQDSIISIYLNDKNVDSYLINGIACYYIEWIEKAMESFHIGRLLDGKLILIFSNHIVLYMNF
jgi:hypothetical protein